MIESFDPSVEPQQVLLTPGQSKPRSDCNEEGTLHFTKLYDKSLTMKWFSVISMLKIGGGSYPSAERQSVYSTALANKVRRMLKIGASSITKKRKKNLLFVGV